MSTTPVAKRKAFSALDGVGLKLLMQAGVRIAWITGSRAPAVMHRARALGIDRVIQGAEDKLTPWEALRGELDLPAAACAHIGDDLPDVPVLARCGFAVTVPHAPPSVRASAHFVTVHEGGRGAVRELCELILAAQGTPQPRSNATAPTLTAFAAPRGGAQCASGGRARTDDSPAPAPRSPGGLVTGAPARLPRGAHLLAGRAGAEAGATRRRIVAARPRSLHRTIQRGQLRRRRPGAADARGDPGRAFSGRRQRRSHRAVARADRPRHASDHGQGRYRQGHRRSGNRHFAAARSGPRATPRLPPRATRTPSGRRRSPRKRCASFRRRRGPKPTSS